MKKMYVRQASRYDKKIHVGLAGVIMDREFRMMVSDKGKYRIMRLSGAFGSSETGNFRAKLAGFFDDAVTSREENVVIDLSGLTFTGLDFVNEICSRRRQLDGTRLRLSLVTPDRMNHELFEMTGLSSLYPVYDTEDSFVVDRIGVPQ